MSDAQLMRYVHDELDEAERTQVEAEVAAVPDTAARLRVLQRRTTRLSALLEAADPSAPDVSLSARRIRPVVDDAVIPFDRAGGGWGVRGGAVGGGRPGRTSLLRAAAVAVLLLGSVLLVEPARAWVVDQLRAFAEAVGLNDATVDPAGDPADAQSARADVRVSFAWSSSTFEIVTGIANGTIVISRGGDDTITAETIGSADASIMVTPAGIRIEGAGDVNAAYAVTVPPVVEVVTLRGGGRVTEHRVPDSGMLRLPLR